MLLAEHKGHFQPILYIKELIMRQVGLPLTLTLLSGQLLLFLKGVEYSGSMASQQMGAMPLTSLFRRQDTH